MFVEMHDSSCFVEFCSRHLRLLLIRLLHAAQEEEMDGIGDGGHDSGDVRRCPDQGAFGTYFLPMYSSNIALSSRRVYVVLCCVVRAPEF